MYQGILTDQRDMLYASMDVGDGQTVKGIIRLFDDDVEEAITDTYIVAGLEFGQDIVVEKREVSDELEAAIREEIDILREKTDLQESTIKQIEKQMAEGVSQGMTTKEIQLLLSDAGIFDSVRALRIARTITGAGASQGQWLSGMITGATHKTWMNAGDDHVRKRHRAPLNGSTVGINEVFMNGARYPVDPLLSAADRINCFLPGTKIQGRFTKALKSFYSGQAVEIITRNGNILRVTYNHPILTKDGFVPAGSLEKSAELVSYHTDINGPVGNGPLSSGVSNKNNSPVEIEKVFSAFKAFGFSEFPRGSAGDFHGDGESIKGDIEVVYPTSSLLSDLMPPGSEGFGNRILMVKDSIFKDSVRLSTFSFAGKGVLISSTGFPCGFALPGDLVGIFLDLLPLDEFSLGLGSELNSVSLENNINDINGICLGDLVPNPVVIFSGSASKLDTGGIEDLVNSGSIEKLLYNLTDTYPRNVIIDEVVSARLFSYSGFVHDVESPFGWVVADGIFTSNCRCSLAFEIQ